jgi:hypothetical protein
MVTPGSIDKVTSDLTRTGAVTIYGLFALVQVVSEAITPLTLVAALTGST